MIGSAYRIWLGRTNRSLTTGRSIQMRIDDYKCGLAQLSRALEVLNRKLKALPLAALPRGLRVP